MCFNRSHDSFVRPAQSLGDGDREIARSAGQVQNLDRGRSVHDLFQGLLAPDLVHVQRKYVIQRVIVASDAVEHILNL